MEHCGNISAESIEEYIAAGGYNALCKALFEMTPEAIVEEVSASGLRGRGGAGFPAGKKWSQVAALPADPVKYVVCNADEGDPGAFMDCSVMEGDPHRMNIYVELTGIGDLGALTHGIKAQGCTIYDLELNKSGEGGARRLSAIYTVSLQKKQEHAELLARLSAVDGVVSIEEN